MAAGLGAISAKSWLCKVALSNAGKPASEPSVKHIRSERRTVGSRGRIQGVPRITQSEGHFRSDQ